MFLRNRNRKNFRRRPQPKRNALRRAMIEQLENRRVLAGPGDIAFVGFNADSPDAIAFVALNDIPAGTTIGITDNESNGLGGFNDFSEGELEWSHTFDGCSWNGHHD